MFSRNSFIGLASPDWGALKIGKTDAPYKVSTVVFNPFAGELGDYSVIMGNTGGDNRVEFGTRLDHAIWYESPRFGGGFAFNFLFAPGQNLASNSDNIAAGESDCAGGDNPESGADYPVACNDGAFSNAVSTNLSYTNGPLYVTAAYEFHNNVNRQSDITAMYGVTSGPMPNATAQTLFNQDVANEQAAKIGALYNFSTKTTVGAIVEYMNRDVPSDLEFQNERTRFGTWLVVSQQLSENDSIHFGWAHAFRAPGDPGQHNDSTLTTVDGAGGLRPQRQPGGHAHRGVQAQAQPEPDLVRRRRGDDQRTLRALRPRCGRTRCHDRLPRCQRRVRRPCGLAAMLDRANPDGCVHRPEVDLLTSDEHSHRPA